MNLVTIRNPMKQEFAFRWDGQTFYLPPGKEVQFEDYLAHHGAKHLTDYIILHPETWTDAAPERSGLPGSARENVTVGREEILARIIVGSFDPSLPATDAAVGDGETEKTDEGEGEEKPAEATAKKGAKKTAKKGAKKTDEFEDAKHLD